MAVCKSCGIGHIRPDDLFCWFCGRSVLAFEFLAGTHVIPVGEAGKWFDVSVLARNTGLACIDIRVPQQPPSPRVELSGLPLEARLVPGEEYHLQFKALFHHVSNGESYELQVESSARTHDKTIRFYSPGEPQVHIRFKDDDEVVLTGSEHLRAVLEIYNDGPCIAEIVWKNLPAWLDTAEDRVVVHPFSPVEMPCSILPEKVPEQAQGGEAQDRFTVSVRKAADPVKAAQSVQDNHGKQPEEQVDIDFEDFEDVEVATPKFTKKRPAFAQFFRVGEDGKQEEIFGSINLGQLVPAERRREQFILKNGGEVDMPVEPIYTMFAPDDPAFIAVLDGTPTSVPPGPSGCPFRINIDASCYDPGHHTPKIMFDFGPCGSKEIVVEFMVSKMQEYPGILAIDFGTSNSCVAVCEDRFSDAVAIETKNSAYIPSVAYFFSPEEYVFGEEAKEWARADPGNTVSNLKRALTGEGRNIRGKQFTPNELVATMMRELMSIAAHHLNQVPTRLAVTVPVGFSETQRSIIREAARHMKTFVRDVQVLDEPTAAAMHFSFCHPEIFEGSNGASPKNILVFDFGGGTLDISILKMTAADFDIMARRGDARLGGIDLDRLVAIDMADRVLQKYPRFEKDAVALPRKRFDPAFEGRGGIFHRMRYTFAGVSEATKVELSLEETVRFEFERSLLVDTAGKLIGEGFADDMTKVQLEKVIKERIEHSLEVLTNCLDAAQLDKTQIDIVLMTGQVCRTPSVRKRVEDYFHGTKAHIPGVGEFDVKSCVAMGAAKLAHVLQNDPSRKSRFQSSAGRIGYLDHSANMHLPLFVTVLPDRHEYGTEGPVPIKIHLDEYGGAPQPIFKNIGNSDYHDAKHKHEFQAFGQVHIKFEDRPNQYVELYLGLDANGDVTARVEGIPLKVEFSPMESDEVW